MIAAGAVVLANTIVEPNSLYAGIPAKRIKEIDEKLRLVIDKTPQNYIMYSSWVEEGSEI
ncbi:MAG: carbonic anhydrase/acetyltransferase-like protein (isoleucine patch superfamily) [Roseivirga sp.]|jgi:carbonic anhydrase/acetyltransferase-like protein (isoleucine patch superfamily)